MWCIPEACQRQSQPSRNGNTVKVALGSLPVEEQGNTCASKSTASPFKHQARQGILGESSKNKNAESQGQLTEISLEYEYRYLAAATDSFSAESRLGAGAAGAVYRGKLAGGTEVAVKVFADGGELTGFEDEVRVLSRFRHPNLVTLLGWSQNKSEKYLVYELLLGGDLHGKLTKCREGLKPFAWDHRLRIALDAARGLFHMANSQPKIFHRDIKPANILISTDGTAKMADFGLASVVPSEGRAHLTVDQISGTPGYACPTYMQTGQVSEHSEVYSFGTVLLELLVNLPPAALAGANAEIIFPLLKAVQPAAPGAHARVIQKLDQRAEWPQRVADELADLALSCIDMTPDRRPSFANVVRDLRNIQHRSLGSQLRESSEHCHDVPSITCAAGGSEVSTADGEWHGLLHQGDTQRVDESDNDDDEGDTPRCNPWW